MTFKFKLTKPIESLGPYDLNLTCTEDLRNLLKQQSRLVNYTPRAIYQEGIVVGNDRSRTHNSYLDVWEYELTNRQQQMLNVAGAELHNLWRGLEGRNLYIDQEIKWTQENSL